MAAWMIQYHRILAREAMITQESVISCAMKGICDIPGFVR